jgi:hypothetical protein
MPKTLTPDQKQRRKEKRDEWLAKPEVKARLKAYHKIYILKWRLKPENCQKNVEAQRKWRAVPGNRKRRRKQRRVCDAKKNGRPFDHITGEKDEDIMDKLLNENELLMAEFDKNNL